MAPLHNLATALFQLGTAESRRSRNRSWNGWSNGYQAPEQPSLRQAFAIWLRDVLPSARLPGVRIDAVLELSEVRNMLAERTIEWTQAWKQEGW